MGLYRLAHELGWSVERLCDELSLKEYYGWIEYFVRTSEARSGSGATAPGPGPIELASASPELLRALF